jgi:hypothetical protein
MNGTLRILDAASGGVVGEAADLSATPLVLRWLGRSGRIVCGLRDGRIALTNVRDREPPRFLDAHAGPVQCLAVTSDESFMASGAGSGGESPSLPPAPATLDDHAILIWDVQNWRMLRRLEGHSRTVTGLAYSADGRLLASGSMDGRVMVWKAGSGERLASFADVGEARALAFSPDGLRLAALCMDGALRIWDSARYEGLLTLRTGASGTLAAAFSPDGNTLVATGGVAAAIAFETSPSLYTEDRFNAMWAYRLLTQRIHQISEDTIAELDGNVSLPPGVQAAALRHVRLRGDHANYLNSEAILDSRRLEDREEWLASARRKAELALEILPGDPGYLATYGGILCRQKQHDEALLVLRRSNEGFLTRGNPIPLENWAFLALCHHHLGDGESAREARRQMRAVRAAGGSEDAETLRLNESVESLLGAD